MSTSMSPESITWGTSPSPGGTTLSPSPENVGSSPNSSSNSTESSRVITFAISYTVYSYHTLPLNLVVHGV